MPQATAANDHQPRTSEPPREQLLATCAKTANRYARLASKAGREAERVRYRSLAYSIEAGRWLQRAFDELKPRRELGRGRWGEWLKKNFNGSEEAARAHRRRYRDRARIRQRAAELGHDVKRLSQRRADTIMRPLRPLEDLRAQVMFKPHEVPGFKHVTIKQGPTTAPQKPERRRPGTATVAVPIDASERLLTGLRLLLQEPRAEAAELAEQHWRLLTEARTFLDYLDQQQPKGQVN